MVTRHTCVTSRLLFYVSGCHVAETSLVVILNEKQKRPKSFGRGLLHVIVILLLSIFVRFLKIAIGEVFR